jgi:hypothetical protein
MHHNILRTPGVFGAKTQAPAGGITGFVYQSIRGVTRLVGGGIDAALDRLVPLFGAPARSSAPREAVLAALNGLLGDHLQARSNPLAITMQWRRDGRALDLAPAALAATLPDVGGKLLLLVHGLCMNDLLWRRNGHDHGAALAADRGYTPVYLHYNSGLHVSTNGREFARQIEALLRAWPVPVEQVAIVAHSMGGLVTRSAFHHGAIERHAWPQRVDKVVFLGTPHHGAPLERGGNWIDAALDASPYTTAFARLGKIRSAGITDLRHGSMVDADWEGRDRFARSRRKPQPLPLPSGVAWHALAASLAKKGGHATARWSGDGLVPLDSALGIHADTRRTLNLPRAQRWIGLGMHHLDLLDRREVYAHIRHCL